MIWLPVLAFFQVLLVGLWLGRYLQSLAPSTSHQKEIECLSGYPGLAPNLPPINTQNGKEYTLTSLHDCEVIDLNEYRKKKESEARKAEDDKLEEDISYLKAILANLPGEPIIGPYPSLSCDLWDLDTIIFSHNMTSGSYEMNDFSYLPVASPMLPEDT
jgi:hypothetical protein